MDGMMGGGALSPEQIQALLDYSTNQGAFTEQDRAIQQQLKMAEALRERGQSQHTTGAGAMFGGIGDMLNAYAGKRDMKSAQEQDRALQQARIEALRKLAAGYGQQPQMQAQQPDAGFLDPGVAAIYARRRQQQTNPYYVDPGPGGD